MVLNNTKTQRIIRAAFGLSNIDSIPNPVPVVNVNPKDYELNNVLGSVTSGTSGTLTIFTANATKTTVVTGLQFSFVKNAACDMATGSIFVALSVGGASKVAASLAVLTLTAQENAIAIVFKHPIIVDKGAVANISGSFAAGACIRTATIHGYEVENFEI